MYIVYKIYIMKTALLFLLYCSASFTQAQIGIGTISPSSNSALDVTSTNKGLMLPRLTDTGNVSNPSAGLLIYNMNTKSPAFHDGTKWNSISAAAATGNDSITYTITNAGSGFSNGTFKIEAVSHGLSNGGGAGNFQDYSFTKLLDINSTGFAKGVATGSVSGAMVIEIKFYTRGAATPYYSLKGTTVRITGYSVSANTGEGFFSESISFDAAIHGYKDWINNLSFAWNSNTNQLVSY